MLVAFSIQSSQFDVHEENKKPNTAHVSSTATMMQKRQDREKHAVIEKFWFDSLTERKHRPAYGTAAIFHSWRLHTGYTKLSKAMQTYGASGKCAIRECKQKRQPNSIERQQNCIKSIDRVWEREQMCVYVLYLDALWGFVDVVAFQSLSHSCTQHFADVHMEKWKRKWKLAPKTIQITLCPFVCGVYTDTHTTGASIRLHEKPEKASGRVAYKFSWLWWHASARVFCSHFLPPQTKIKHTCMMTTKQRVKANVVCLLFAAWISI